MAEVGLVGVAVGEWVVMVGVEYDEVAVVRVEVEHDAVVVVVAHAVAEVEHGGEEEAGLVAEEPDVEAAGVEWVAQAAVVVAGLEGVVGAERAAQAVVAVVALEGVAEALDRKGLVALDQKGLEERRCWVEGRRGRGNRGLEGWG